MKSCHFQLLWEEALEDELNQIEEFCLKNATSFVGKVPEGYNLNSPNVGQIVSPRWDFQNFKTFSFCGNFQL